MGMSDWLQWTHGRQGTGYEKMLLARTTWPLGFDCYLLRYAPGSSIPPHTDPVTTKRHYRLNIVVWHATEGGEFECATPIYVSPRIKFFRPDACEHSVTPVISGTRYVFSMGWTLKAKS